MSNVGIALTLLRTFLDGEDEIGVREMSRMIGVSKSTVQRLASELAREGFLEQNPETGAYRLGLALLELGSLVQMRSHLHTAGLQSLERLRDVSGETAHLGVLDGIDLVYVAKVESTQSIRLSTRVGGRKPTYCTAIGKALLAFQSDELVEEVIAAGLEARTANTIASGSQLKDELRRIAAEGYAVDREEYEIGLRCVGAPVRDHTASVVAALSVAGPAWRMTSRELTELPSIVMTESERLSRALGWVPRLQDSPGGRAGASETRTGSVGTQADR